MCDICTPRPKGARDLHTNTVEDAAKWEREMAQDDARDDKPDWSDV